MKARTTISSMLALGLVIALGDRAHASTFPFWCRGPLKIELRDRTDELGYVRISFQRTSSAAGSQGQNVAAGQCAWVDRAVSSSEPAVVRSVAWRASNDLFGASGDYLFAVEASLLAQALTTDRYLIKFKAVDNQGGFLMSHDDFVLVPVP
jgi:hypothetical protein